MGIIPMIVAGDVIRIGRRRIRMLLEPPIPTIMMKSMTSPPTNPHPNGEHDRHAIGKGAELRHQNQIEQNERQAETDRETAERFLHPEHHAAKPHTHVRRVRNRIHDVLDGMRYPAQVLGSRRHVNIGGLLNSIMIHFRRALRVHQFEHRVQRGGLFESRRRYGGPREIHLHPDIRHYADHQHSKTQQDHDDGRRCERGTRTYEPVRPPTVLPLFSLRW